MKDLLPELAKLIQGYSPEDGLNVSAIPGVHCVKFSNPTPATKGFWRASFSIIAQGSKEIIFDHKPYQYNQADYIAIPIDLPVSSRIFLASPEKPFLSLKIEFDSPLLSEVAQQLAQDFNQDLENPSQIMFGGQAGSKMLEAALRLVGLFQTPEEARVLGSLVIKELFYHLLKSSNGQAIWQFIRSGSKMHRISQTIYKLKSEGTKELDVVALAKAVNMSRSAFFKHFKEVTALSPVQYQKRLRLLEARRLMLDEGETAEGSAFKVGYNSASQFSREYSRMFGNPPFRDTIKMKNTGQPIHQI